MTKHTNPKQQMITVRRQAGGELQVCIPRTVEDVDQQPEIPAWFLAMLAFAQVSVDGGVRWSPHARDVLRRLSAEYGDEEMRRQLRGLLIDMQGGFKPDNPVGLLIHRVRANGTTAPLSI